jgi:AcrR family transcriptional regulator
MTDTEVRQQILLAAIKLAGEKGFANLSMNDLVRESGVSKGGVYWHFKNKDAIIQAIFDFILAEQIKIVDANLSDAGSATDKLRRIFRLAEQEAAGQFASPLDLYALAARDKTLSQRLSAYFDDYQQRIILLVQQGIDEGEFAPHDPKLTATNIISLLEGVFLVGLLILPGSDFGAQVENAVNLLLEGLSKRDEEQ